MRRMLLGLSVLFVSGLGLAASEPPRSEVLPGADRNECMSTSFIRERRVLDTRRIVVWSGTTAYLLELGRPLQGLDRGSNIIHFVDGDGDGLLCRTVRDGVVLDDTLLPKRTHAAGVIKLDQAQLQALEERFETSLAPRRAITRGADGP